MALDDSAEIDPSTLPHALKLQAEINGLSAEVPNPLSAPARGEITELLIEAARVAVAAFLMGCWHVVQTILARRTFGRALVLSRTDAPVFTEAKLRVKGWTPNLGGFDIAVAGAEGSLVLIETKWGNV
jgi:hypothetical protein